MSEEKEPTLTIDDPWLGKRKIENGRAALIRDQLNLLNKFKNDGRKPSKELLDDISVYEFILNSQDPDVFAEAYFQEKNRLSGERKTFLISKAEVAKNLGWQI